MKAILFIVLAVLLVLVSVSASAQMPQEPYVDSFVPLTLTAGTAMSARTFSASTDDTTRAFAGRGYAAIYVGLESSTNDTLNPVFIQYRVSRDASTYSAFALVDSVSMKNGVNEAQYRALPAQACGAPYVQVRIYTRAGGDIGAPTAPKLTTKIIRVLYGTKPKR